MKRIAASFYAALAGAALFAAEPAQDTLIVHRGESVDAPENTLPAYNAELRPVKFWQEHGKNKKEK